MALSKQITDARDALRALEAQQADTQRRCRHEWTPIKYDPIVREAYRDPGDTPGTMGVDFRGPTYVPRHETARWSRHCPKCELTEYTQRTKPPAETPKIPDFGS